MHCGIFFLLEGEYKDLLGRTQILVRSTHLFVLFSHVYCQGFCTRFYCLRLVLDLFVLLLAVGVVPGLGAMALLFLLS